MTYKHYGAIALSVLVLAGLGYFIPAFLLPCNDIACFRKHDPWFSARMDDSIPVFITRENAGPILHYIDREDIRQAVLVALDRLQESVKRVQATLPATKPITCAVVGNSNNLIGSHYGTQIDNHRYVFRMNNAPLDHFVEDVGTRVTHHAIHSGWGFIKNYTPNTIHILYLDNLGGNYKDDDAWEVYQQKVARDLIWVAQQVAPDVFPKDAEMSIMEFPKNLDKIKGGVLLVHPYFTRYINDDWFDPDHHTRLQWPSTGLRTLLVALTMCDRIDLFGFGKVDPDTLKWKHYFSDSVRNTAGHRPAFQEEVLMDLEQRGIIHRYMGTEEP